MVVAVYILLGLLMYAEVEDRDGTRIEDEVSESCSLPVCDAEITLAVRKLKVDC